MTDKQHINGMYSVDEMTKKEEFEKFIKPKYEEEITIIGKDRYIRLNVDKLWSWIENEIQNARMEQDIINHKGFLDKQDEIVRLAKIEALREQNRRLNSYQMLSEESNERAKIHAMIILENEVLISELEKEK